MARLNEDCWRSVIRFLSGDHDALFQLGLTCRSLFNYVIPQLYRSPLIEFSGLADKKKIILEDRLLIQLCHDPLPLDHILNENSAYLLTTALSDLDSQPPPFFDYYSLIQEMPDRPIIRQSDSAGDLVYNRKQLHRYMFGSKIKTANLSTGSYDYLQEAMEYLSGLENLNIDDSDDGGCSEFMYSEVRLALEKHQTLHPGVLKTVSYMIMDENGARIRTDPRMMMTIHDVMGGQWCTDEITFEIPNELDQDLLDILQDPDLPDHLRIIKFVHQHSSPEDHWIQPLRVFLSRCKRLDAIIFHGFLPTTLLDWSLDTNNTSVEHSTALTSCSTDKVQWKSIRISHYLLGIRKPLSRSEIDDLLYIWRILVLGFGHCVENLTFSICVYNRAHMRYFPTLSLPKLVHLPKLHTLDLNYPYFYRVAYSGVENLRKLMLYVDVLHMAKDETTWNDWKLWSKLETLHLPRGFTDFGVEIFEPAGLGQDLERPRPSSALLSFLPKLKTVTMSG